MEQVTLPTTDAVNLTGGMHAWVPVGNPIVNRNGNPGLVL